MNGYNSGGGRVCVTGASGFVGSWLVMRLLERGYYVKASVRNPGDEKKVKHLLELPKAKTHLSIWKGDLTEEGSFDDAIHGCEGVFHVATHMDFLSTKDPENDVIKPTVNGVLSILRSCSKAKTVKRIIYTSTTGTVTVQSQPQVEYNESIWTDVDFCKARNFTGWSYFVAKTMAEKAAWDLAKEYDIDLVTILPSLVVGPFITPFRPSSVGLGIALFTKNEAVYPLLKEARAVHVDDVCNAHIYLFEHPQAQGRYICCSHNYTIFDLAKSLNLKYPEEKIPINFEGFDESLKVVPCSSKKLLDLGFTFTYNPIEYNVGDIVHETIECCRERGL